MPPATIVADELANYLAGQRLAEVTPTVTALRQRAADVVEAELHAARFASARPRRPAARRGRPHRAPRGRQAAARADRAGEAAGVRRPVATPTPKRLRELFELKPGPAQAVAEPDGDRAAATDDLAAIDIPTASSPTQDPTRRRFESQTTTAWEGIAGMSAVGTPYAGGSAPVGASSRHPGRDRARRTDRGRAQTPSSSSSRPRATSPCESGREDRRRRLHRRAARRARRRAASTSPSTPTRTSRPRPTNGSPSPPFRRARIRATRSWLATDWSSANCPPVRRSARPHRAARRSSGRSGLGLDIRSAARQPRQRAPRQGRVRRTRRRRPGPRRPGADRTSGPDHRVLEPVQMLPAPAQGALAVECRPRTTALIAILSELDDPSTRAAVHRGARTARRARGRLHRAGRRASPRSSNRSTTTAASSTNCRVRGCAAAIDGSDVIRASIVGLAGRTPQNSAAPSRGNCSSWVRAS